MLRLGVALGEEQHVQLLTALAGNPLAASSAGGGSVGGGSAIAATGGGAAGSACGSSSGGSSSGGSSSSGGGSSSSGASSSDGSCSVSAIHSRLRLIQSAHAELTPASLRAIHAAFSGSDSGGRGGGSDSGSGGGGSGGGGSGGSGSHITSQFVTISPDGVCSGSGRECSSSRPPSSLSLINPSSLLPPRSLACLSS